MTKFERLLLPNSMEMPECRCGHLMTRVSTRAKHSDSVDPEYRHYRCEACAHELKITVWQDIPEPAGAAIRSGP